MPGPMMGAAPAMGAAMKPPTLPQFNSNAPGGGPQVQGVNSGLQYLQQAANLSGQTTNAQQQQLGHQLQNNQANVQQNLTNRGLGNTTVSQTMAQAPLQTYNTGMAQVGDLNAQRQMGAYGNLANAAMQGGTGITNTAQPYAQTNFTQQKMQQMMGPKQTYSPQMPSDFQQGQAGGAGGAMAQQNAAAMQNYNQNGFQANAGTQPTSYNPQQWQDLMSAANMGGGGGGGDEFGE